MYINLHYCSDAKTGIWTQTTNGTSSPQMIGYTMNFMFWIQLSSDNGSCEAHFFIILSNAWFVCGHGFKNLTEFWIKTVFTHGLDVLSTLWPHWPDRHPNKCVKANSPVNWSEIMVIWMFAPSFNVCLKIKTKRLLA